MYGGNGQGVRTGVWFAARRSPALQSAQILVRSLHCGKYGEFCNSSVSAIFPKLRNWIWSLFCVSVHASCSMWGAQGSLRCATALWKQGATSHRGNQRSGASAPRATERVDISNRLSAHLPPAFPPFFPPSVFSVWWINPSSAVWSQPTKAGAGYRNLNEKYLSYGFSQHRHYCWYIHVCLWLVFTISCAG